MNQVESFTLDELIVELAHKELLKDTYGHCSLPVPPIVNEEIKLLKDKIKSRRKDFLSAQQKTITARLEQLKTADEKRADLNRELEAVTKALEEG